MAPERSGPACLSGRDAAGRLAGTTALVTGSSRGIGYAIAARLHAEGASVMLNARRAEPCAAAASSLDGRCGWVDGNCGEPADIERIVSATIERFGRVDLLVNNAATNPYAGPTIEVDLGRWEKTLKVNLTGPLLLTQEVWRASQKEHGGSVVNVSSVGGFVTNPILGPYDVSKAALTHLTKQLAAELGPGVRVNAVAPGLVRTDFAKSLWSGRRGDAVARRYPMKRLGEPADVAEAVLFLADAKASGWMTGQTLVVDGGDLVGFPTVADEPAGSPR